MITTTCFYLFHPSSIRKSISVYKIYAVMWRCWDLMICGFDYYYYYETWLGGSVIWVLYWLGGQCSRRCLFSVAAVLCGIPAYCLSIIDVYRRWALAYGLCVLISELWRQKSKLTNAIILKIFRKFKLFRKRRTNVIPTCS